MCVYTRHKQFSVKKDSYKMRAVVFAWLRRPVKFKEFEYSVLSLRDLFTHIYAIARLSISPSAIIYKVGDWQFFARLCLFAIQNHCICQERDGRLGRLNIKAAL